MRTPLWLGLVAVVAAACSSGTGKASMTEPIPVDRDIHSFARPWEARVTHVALDLTADFTAKTLAGSATLGIERAAGARQVVLDTKGLKVERVTDRGGAPLNFTLGDPDTILGRPLTVELPASGPITVVYRTSPDAAALQWLAPSQTAGKSHPYLYSQGQAILTRTWIPTQDSPGVRQTYAASITVPRELRAVMSAEQLTPEGEDGPSGRTFRFRMTRAIPSYLIAIAIGDLAFRP